MPVALIGLLFWISHVAAAYRWDSLSIECSLALTLFEEEEEEEEGRRRGRGRRRRRKRRRRRRGSCSYTIRKQIVFFGSPYAYIEVHLLFHSISPLAKYEEFLVENGCRKLLIHKRDF